MNQPVVILPCILSQYAFVVVFATRSAPSRSYIVQPNPIHLSCVCMPICTLLRPKTHRLAVASTRSVATLRRQSTAPPARTTKRNIRPRQPVRARVHTVAGVQDDLWHAREFIYA